MARRYESERATIDRLEQENRRMRRELEQERKAKPAEPEADAVYWQPTVDLDPDPELPPGSIPAEPFKHDGLPELPGRLYSGVARQPRRPTGGDIDPFTGKTTWRY